MLKRRNVGSAASDEDDVNMTPLLDIVFIMLIFFIVTATFIKEPGVQIERPEAETAIDQKLVSILIAIRSDDQIWINKEEVPLEGVRSTVERLLRENPRGSAVIQADAGSHTGRMVDVLNQVKAAGVSKIAVSAKKS
jgi:biopolymer transport protein ExbD